MQNQGVQTTNGKTPEYNSKSQTERNLHQFVLKVKHVQRVITHIWDQQNIEQKIIGVKTKKKKKRGKQ